MKKTASLSQNFANHGTNPALFGGFGHKSETAKQAKTDTAPKLSDATITAENIFNLSAVIAIKCIKANLSRGAEVNGTLATNLTTAVELSRQINTLLSGYYDGKNVDFSGRFDGFGADLVQDVALYLTPFIGSKLSDPDPNAKKGKNGETPEIIKVAYRIVSTAIMRTKRTTQWVHGFVENPETGETMEIPYRWDIPAYADYVDTDNLLLGMDLTERQKAVLAYRLQGVSIHQIAEKMGISRQAVQKHLALIGEKYGKIAEKMPLYTAKIGEKQLNNAEKWIEYANLSEIVYTNR